VQRAGRKRRNALDQKCARLPKRRQNRDLESRAAQAGRVRHDGNQGAVLIVALTTSAGRVLPVWPKSISQTSPR